MARLIVDGINAPQLQTQSAGRVQVNTVAPQTSATKLLSALSTGGSAIAKGFAKLQEVNNKEDEAAADAFFNGKTLGDIGKLIKQGELPPDASPVFTARVEHNYGTNYLAQLTRDAEEKLANGEFAAEGKDPVQAFDEYLTNARNSFAEGASKYTMAGFDKGFSRVKVGFQDVIAKQATAERMQAAQGSATESLVNLLSSGEQADEFGVKGIQKGTVGALVAEYRNQITQLNLSPANRKGVLTGIAQEFVARGDAAGLEELWNTELDNGITVGSVVGSKNPATKRQLFSMAKEAETKKNRERGEYYHDMFTQQVERGELDMQEFNRVRPRFEPYMDFGGLVTRNQAMQAAMLKDAEKRERSILYESSVQRYNDSAVEAVRQNLINGEVVNQADRVVTKPTGSEETLKWEDSVKAAIDRETDGNLEARARAYASFGFEDDYAKRELSQLSSNVFNTVNPDGTLPETVLEKYELFRTYNATNPAYTKQLMGTNYEEMRDFDVFQRLGDSPEQAASSLRLVKQSSMESADASSKALAKSIDSRMVEITERGMFSNIYTRIFGTEAEKNLYLGSDVMYGQGEIGAAIRKRAKALLLSGQTGNADEAIQAAFSGVLKSGAVVRANQQLYWAEDLPSRLPEGMRPPEAMEVYRRALVSTFEQAGMSFSEDNILLTPNRNGSFTVKIRDSGGNIAIPTVNGKRVEPTLRMVEDYMAKRQRRLDAERINEQRSTQRNTESLDFSFAP